MKPRIAQQKALFTAERTRLNGAHGVEVRARIGHIFLSYDLIAGDDTLAR